MDKLPPTPSRFHYILNLRDLSRVTEGLLLSTPDNFATVAQLVRLWRNEVLRVFHDRLICAEDKKVGGPCCHLPFISPGMSCTDTAWTLCLCASTKGPLVCCSWCKNELRPSFSRSFNQQQTTLFRTLSYLAISRPSSR